MFPIRDTIPSRHAPVMTWLLIAANVAAFVYELTLPAEAREAIFYQFGMVPARYTDPARHYVYPHPSERHHYHL